MGVLKRCRAILVEEDWMVGVIEASIASLLTPGPLPKVRWLRTPDRQRYLADPFGLPGQTKVWCEELRHGDGIGRLIELDLAAGTERVLSMPNPLAGGHLSYPFLFEDGGALYCLPEAVHSRTCVICRLDDGDLVPYATVAKNQGLADATLFIWGGWYWLAASDVDLGAMDTLSLFYAPTLGGPWLPHRGNPVKRDRGSSRPGGTPFIHQGELYRPAQDCSRTYGGAIVINRVTALDPSTFAEEIVRIIAPPPGRYRHGIHTLAAWGDRTLVDAKRHVVNSVALRRKVLRRLAPRTK